MQMRRMRRVLRTCIAIIPLLFVPALSRAQESDQTPSQQKTPSDQSQKKQKTAAKNAPDPTIETDIDATEAQEAPKRQLVHWNEYQGPHFTVRAGAGFLYEVAGFAQDQPSKEQFPLAFKHKVRDFRFLLAGKFPSSKR